MPACFVDADDGGVLVENGEGKILGLGLEGREVGGGDVDVFAALEEEGRLGGFGVDGDVTVANPVLEAGAGVFRELGLQMMIQPLAGSFGSDEPIHDSTVS
jgi:hypothetical protein